MSHRNMPTIQYQVYASPAQLAALVKSLSEVNGVLVTAEPARAESSFVETRPLGHMGVLDFVVSIVVSVGSGLVANALSAKINEWRLKNPNASIEETKAPAKEVKKDGHEDA